METYIEFLKEQYGSNFIVSWSGFSICAFDKLWSMFSKRVTWVTLYCQWFKFVKTFVIEIWSVRFTWKLDRILEKDNIGITVSSLMQFFNKLSNTKRFMSLRWKFIEKFIHLWRPQKMKNFVTPGDKKC